MKTKTISLLVCVILTLVIKAASGDCLVTASPLYRGSDGFWRLPFANGCNDTVFVTVTYKGRRPGACIPPHSSREVTLYFGDNEPDSPISWDAQYSNCGG